VVINQEQPEGNPHKVVYTGTREQVCAIIIIIF
jgi:hypothetical protein